MSRRGFDRGRRGFPRSRPANLQDRGILHTSGYMDSISHRDQYQSWESGVQQGIANLGKGDTGSDTGMPRCPNQEFEIGTFSLDSDDITAINTTSAPGSKSEDDFGENIQIQRYPSQENLVPSAEGHEIKNMGIGYLLNHLRGSAGNQVIPTESSTSKPLPEDNVDARATIKQRAPFHQMLAAGDASCVQESGSPKGVKILDTSKGCRRGVQPTTSHNDDFDRNTKATETTSESIEEDWDQQIAKEEARALEMKESKAEEQIQPVPPETPPSDLNTSAAIKSAGWSLDTTKGCRRGVKEGAASGTNDLHELKSAVEYNVPVSENWDDDMALNTWSSGTVLIDSTQNVKSGENTGRAPGSYTGKVSGYASDHPFHVHYAPGSYTGNAPRFEDKNPGSSTIASGEVVENIDNVSHADQPFHLEHTQHKEFFEKDVMHPGNIQVSNRRFQGRNSSSVNFFEPKSAPKSAEIGSQGSMDLNSLCEKLMTEDGKLALSQEALKANPKFNPLPVATKSQVLTSQRRNNRDFNKSAVKNTGVYEPQAHVSFNQNVQMCDIPPLAVDLSQPFPRLMSINGAKPVPVTRNVSGNLNLSTPDFSKPPPLLGQSQDMPPAHLSACVPDLSRPPPTMVSPPMPNMQTTVPGAIASNLQSTDDLLKHGELLLSSMNILGSDVTMGSMATTLPLAGSTSGADLAAVSPRPILAPRTAPISILKRPNQGANGATGEDESLKLRTKQFKDIDKILEQAATFTRHKDNTAEGEKSVGKSGGNEASEIKWTDLKQEYIGQFFVNRVFLSEDKARVWTPKNLTDKHTIPMEFEQVVIGTGLQEAVIADTCMVTDLVPYLLRFPAVTRIIVVCPTIPGYEPNLAPRNRTENQVYFCENYARHLTENGDLGCDPHYCVNVREVNLIDGLYRSDINCRIMVLRYSGNVRVVVFSGSLTKVSWQNVQQFGWFCDLPIHQQSPGSTAFGSDLMRIVSHLCDSRTAILRDVDFTRLSKHVNIVSSIPGFHVEKKSEYGHRRVEELRRQCSHLVTSWRSRDAGKAFLNFCQTTKFGRGKAVVMLERLMELNPSIDSRRAPIRILYPSAEYVHRCVESTEGLTAEHLNSMFENWDSTNVSAPYLHNPAAETPVIPHSNIFVSCQSIQASDVTRCYGFLITGSQGLSYGSWGDKGDNYTHRDQYKCSRYELAVSLFPYTNGEEHCAIDLSEIGLPWGDIDIEPYRGVPFVPQQRTDDPGLPIYIGIAERYLIKQGIKKAVFVETLSPNHPLSQKFTPFPANTDTAYIHEDHFLNYGTKIPAVGTVIEFKGKTSNRNTRRKYGKNDNFRAESIVKIFNSMSDVMEFYDLSNSAPGESGPAYEERSEAINRPVYLGVVMRHLSEQVCFVDPLPYDSDLNDKFEQFPQDSSALLTIDSIRAFTGQSELLAIGSVVEFTGYVNLKGKQRNKGVLFRVDTLLKIHDSIKDAAEFFNVSESELAKAIPEPRKSWNEMTAEEQRQNKGIVTDEDFDNYWKQFQPKIQTESKATTDRLNPVDTRPTPVESDMEWLERWATMKAGGRPPKILMGPFNIHLMQLYVEGDRRRFFMDKRYKYNHDTNKFENIGYSR